MPESDDLELQKRAFERKYILDLFAVFMDMQDGPQIANRQVNRESCKEFIKVALQYRKKTSQIAGSLVDKVVDNLFDKYCLDRHTPR